MRWTFGFVLLLALSLVVLAMPARFEGPVLVTITREHGVTVSDVVGFVPLSVGWLAWLVGIWRRRWRLEATIKASPRAATVSAFVGGFGVGLVTAIRLPGGGELGPYQPKHPSPLAAGPSTS